MGFLNTILNKSGKKDKAEALKQNLDTPLEIRGGKKIKAFVTELINRTAKSDAGRAVLEKAAKAGYRIVVEDLEGAFGACDGDEKLIFLGAGKSQDKLVSTLAHEARHAEQMEKGAIKGYDPTKTIASALIEKRLMEGDAVAYSVLVCDQLYAQGDYTPAVAVAHQYPEVFKDFQSAKREAPTGKSVDDAMTGAVLGWFYSEKLKMRYEQQHIARPLSLGLNLDADPKALKTVKAADSLAKICTLGRRSYFTAAADSFKEPVLCGVSRSTKYWIDSYAAAVKSCGGTPEPSVESIPVYHERPSNRVDLSQYPEPLLPCARDRIKNGGEKKSLKSSAIKLLKMAKQKGR